MPSTMSLVTGCFIISLTFLIAVLIKIHSIYNYWNKRGIYTWKPIFPFGNCKDVFFQKIPFGFDVTELYADIKSRSKRFGGYYSFFTPVFVPTDLNLIKQILKTSSDYFSDRTTYVDVENDPLSANLIQLQGERWKKIRAIAQPWFTRKKLNLSFQSCIKKTFDLVAIIDDRTEPFDTKEILDRFFIDMIGSYVLGIEINSMKNKKSEVKHQLINFFNDSVINTFLRFCITSPQVKKFFKIKTFRNEMAYFFIDFINYVIKDKEQYSNHEQVLLDIFKQHEQDKALNLTRNEVIANMTIFLLAGYDTTSNTLTFCLYELSCNKKLQEKLRQEINSMFDKCNNNFTYDNISELSLLDKCLNETFRKYPVSSTISRLCTKEFNIPDSEVIIEKGCHVHIPVRGIHWDPEYYPEPHIFNPERFSNDSKSQQDAFMPFGSGPRRCIGFRFAIIGMKLALVVLLKNFEFSLNAKTNDPLVYNPRAYILEERSGIWLNIKKI